LDKSTRIPTPSVKSLTRRAARSPHTWIRALVRPWEGDHRPRRPAPPARDANLRARKVELRAARAHRHVQRDVLNAEEVVTRGYGGGDRGVRGFVLVCEVG
jgi:hypothetical protein